MILVTGPNGNVGTELVRMLIADGTLPFRIAANTPAKIERLYGPNAPKVRFSFDDRTTWDAALAGVTIVFLLFPLTNIGTVGSLAAALIILTIGLGLTYGPQSALYSELFPASIRFSGVSISYAIGAILGGAFSPMIAQAIFQATGATTGITWYLAGMTVIGLIGTLLLRDRNGIPLGPEHEAEQAKSPIYGLSKA